MSSLGSQQLERERNGLLDSGQPRLPCSQMQPWCFPFFLQSQQSKITGCLSLVCTKLEDLELADASRSPKERCRCYPGQKGAEDFVWGLPYRSDGSDRNERVCRKPLSLVLSLPKLTPFFLFLPFLSCDAVDLFLVVKKEAG